MVNPERRARKRARNARQADARRAFRLKVLGGLGIVIFVLVSCFLIIKVFSPGGIQDIEQRIGVDIKRPSR